MPSLSCSRSPEQGRAKKGSMGRAARANNANRARALAPYAPDVPVVSLSTRPARVVSRSLSRQGHSRPVASTAGTEQPAALAEWPAAFDNTLLRELRAEPPDASPHVSRQVKGSHYTLVRPTVHASKPVLLAYSKSVASLLGLPPEMCESEDFLNLMTGSLPLNFECWATAYGASATGQYGGQRGDGRAISICQCNGLEVQLKGAGVTPYSRGLDGRAVLRSSIREFLASEAMAALRVPTTRSLCVALTGEAIVRQWYDSDGRKKVGNEPGAVGARVATSFLRFGQMELFLRRNEMLLLRELAEHALSREFAHLHTSMADAPLSQKLARMFAEICELQAILVSEWLRVGYCQGNMNSDNAALSGVTLDYGPFAFMEKFIPDYNRERVATRTLELAPPVERVPAETSTLASVAAKPGLEAESPTASSSSRRPQRSTLRDCTRPSLRSSRRSRQTRAGPQAK